MSESPSTSTYPTTLDTWSTITDKEDLAEASDINKLKNGLEAVQTELGTDPAGSLTDLKTRLAINTANNGSIANGSSFPGTPTAMQMYYKSDEDVLYARNAADNAWFKIGETLSNVIYSHTAQVSQTATTKGTYTGTSITPTSGTMNYIFDVINGSTLTTIRTSKWTKISGINTVTVRAQIWQNSTSTAEIKVDIGGQNVTIVGTGSQTTPEWVHNTIDVSSLSDGTTYDITIQIRAQGAGSVSYLGSVVMMGS